MTTQALSSCYAAGWGCDAGLVCGLTLRFCLLLLQCAALLRAAAQVLLFAWSLLVGQLTHALCDWLMLCRLYRVPTVLVNVGFKPAQPGGLHVGCCSRGDVVLLSSANKHLFRSVPGLQQPRGTGKPRAACCAASGSAGRVFLFSCHPCFYATSVLDQPCFFVASSKSA